MFNSFNFCLNVVHSWGHTNFLVFFFFLTDHKTENNDGFKSNSKDRKDFYIYLPKERRWKQNKYLLWEFICWVNCSFCPRHTKKRKARNTGAKTAQQNNDVLGPVKFVRCFHHSVWLSWNVQYTLREANKKGCSPFVFLCMKHYPLPLACWFSKLETSEPHSHL